MVADRLLVGSADVVAERLAEIKPRPTHIGTFMAIPVSSGVCAQVDGGIRAKVMPQLAGRFGDMAESVLRQGMSRSHGFTLPRKPMFITITRSGHIELQGCVSRIQNSRRSRKSPDELAAALDGFAG